MKDISSFLQLIITFCILLSLFTCIKHYARGSRLPSEAWILLAGIAYGLTKRMGEFEAWPQLILNADSILFFFLPLLIFASGRHLNLRIMRSRSDAIFLFAIPGVILTTFLIGIPVALTLDIPLGHGLLFGAAIGATDPIAIGAIFKQFSIPEELNMLVEGESLFNDGTTVVLFSLISAIVLSGSPFSLGNAFLSFLYSVGVAIPMGLSAGWLGVKVLASWREDNMFFTASMGLIVALLVFAIGEHFLHISGVIAVLMAAIVMNNSIRKQEDDEKTTLLNSFWDYMSEVLNGFMFFMLGVATGLHEFDTPFLALIAGVIAMLTARAIVIYGGGMLLRFRMPLPSLWQHILMLGGLRGAVSAALILLIPNDYPHRDDFLCLAFLLIVFSLIFQPPAMQQLLERNKM